MSKHTDIIVILDRSGSMKSIQNDAIEGINSFITEHKNSGAETNISLLLFDHEFIYLYRNQPIKSVGLVNSESYIPRGTTALFDAIGRGINDKKKDIKSCKNSKRPKNVLVTILTDGFENDSRKFTQDQVFKAIETQTQKDKWRFLYLGANQDAIKEGAKIGISDGFCLTFKVSTDGIQGAFDSLIKQSKCMLSDDKYIPKFSQSDRDKQLQ